MRDLRSNFLHAALDPVAVSQRFPKCAKRRNWFHQRALRAVRDSPAATASATPFRFSPVAILPQYGPVHVMGRAAATMEQATLQNSVLVKPRRQRPAHIERPSNA